MNMNLIYDSLQDKIEVDKDQQLEKEKKVKLLRETNLKDLVLSIEQAKSAEQAIPSIEFAVDVFSILDLYSTPSKRKAIEKELLFLFEVFANIVKRLIQYLTFESSPQLQYSSLKLLAYLIEGPRILSIPIEHPLHPDKMHFKQKFRENEGLKIIIGGFLTPKYQLLYPLIVEEVLNILGKYASFNEIARDYLLENGALKPILSMFNGIFHEKNTKINLLKKLTWVLSILCGSTHSNPPEWNLLKDSIHVVGEVLLLYEKVYKDEAILFNLYSCIGFLFPGLSEDTIITKIIEILATSTSNIIHMSLITIHKFCLIDNNTTKIFVKNKLIDILKILLHNTDQEIVLSTLGILCTLVGVRGEITNVVNLQIVPIVIEILLKNEDLRWRCVKFLKYLTRGSLEVMRYLVKEQKLFQIFCHVLTFFESKDSVLKSIYNYIGNSYNFEMIRDALIGLNGLVLAGEIEMEQESLKYNPYIIHFDHECIIKIGNLVKKIKESNDITPWKVEKGGISIEDTCKGLLVKIFEVSSKYDSNEAKQMSTTILQILKTLYGESVFQELDLHNTVFFKEFKERRKKMMEISNYQIQNPNNKIRVDFDFNLEKEEMIKKQLFEDILMKAKELKVEITESLMNNLFEWWKKKCDSDAKVSKAVFKEGLEEIFGIKDKMALEQYYNQFDPSNHGYVDFREFVVGIAINNQVKKINQKKEMEENILKMVFKSYDLDGNGYITVEELYEITRVMMESKGINYNSEILKLETISKFKEIDKDGNGKIDYDEFKLAVLSKILKVNIDIQ